MVLKEKIALSLASIMLTFSYPISIQSTKQSTNTKTFSIEATTKNTSQKSEEWKSKLEVVLEKEKGVSEYLPYVINSVEKYNFPISKLDAALVVVSLLSVETINYDRYAISPAGAAGIAQFIPETATGKFGLKTYMPDYLFTARKDLSSAYSHHKNSEKYLKELEMEKAESEIKEYLRLKKKADNGFLRYKKDLLSKIKDKNGNYLPDQELEKIDERFLPEKEIDACVNFLSQLFYLADGNIRVAVSGYNAGEGRIKKYKGIPPFTETVIYQNKVYSKYRQLKKIVGN